MPKDVNKKEKKHFFKDFKAELKRVIWPTPKQLINNTVAVITIVLITAVIVFALDLAFEKMNTYGVNKLKEVVDSTTKNSTTDEEEQNDENQDNNAVDENTEASNVEENTTE